MNEQKNSQNQGPHPEHLEANLSVLILSIASSATTAMGHHADPRSSESKPDKFMARFHVDLLLLLKEKTKGNLTQDETHLLDAIIHDLQVKFIQMK